MLAACALCGEWCGACGRATREALGLRLKGSIVVVDEAHNLLPAIHGSHSVALPFTGLHGTSKLLASYLDHFQTRLGPVKASTVTAMKNVSDRLADAVAPLLDDPEATAGLAGNRHRVMLPNAFLLGCRLANVNIPKLLAEMNADNLVFKIAGFADTVVKAVAVSGGPVLTVVEEQQQHSPDTAAQVPLFPAAGSCLCAWTPQRTRGQCGTLKDPRPLPAALCALCSGWSVQPNRCTVVRS